MKIAHVLRRLSFDDWGGTEQVVWNLAKAQMHAGHEVRIFATDALCKTPHEVQEGLEVFRFPAIYPWFPMPARLVAELDLKGGNPFVPRLGPALRQWAPDIIHCHAMCRIAELCLRTAKTLGVKCVVSLHGGAANIPTAEAASLRSPTRRLLPWGKALDYLMGWVRRIPEDADGIVCVGEDEYERYHDRHDNVFFLPNGVDVPCFEPCLKRERTSRGDRLRVLCVARIDRQKNQMMLVEALARHPDMTLRCVGPVTQPDYLEEMKARAQALGVADRLTFTGALRPGSAALLGEYRDADVFVLPSRHEPFGIVVLEAWASGLPVIASDIGGLGRLCATHPAAALPFAPGDDAALDAAFAKLAAPGDLAARMAEEGLRAARSYDWRLLGAKLVDFYCTLRAPGMTHGR